MIANAFSDGSARLPGRGGLASRARPVRVQRNGRNRQHQDVALSLGSADLR